MNWNFPALRDAVLLELMFIAWVGPVRYELHFTKQVPVFIREYLRKQCIAAAKDILSERVG